MSVTIRLSRRGRHKRPFYRIVVADSRMPRDGRCIEVIGTYDPLAKPAAVQVKKDRAEVWLAQGAQVSDTVGDLLHQIGLKRPAKN
ncbi:MAG TPA: 30S ribosomal protein S16 [Nitrospiria bacterium]|nr:30S ribosomal protein S16 [Nitrospiria bacterium]